MFRLPNIQTPVEVTTNLIRDGKRIKVVEADCLSGGTHMARASCQLLRKDGKYAGQCVVARELWDAPLPDAIAAPTESEVRRERQMDDTADRRSHGLARARNGCG